MQHGGFAAHDHGTTALVADALVENAVLDELDLSGKIVQHRFDALRVVGKEREQQLRRRGDATAASSCRRMSSATADRLGAQGYEQVLAQEEMQAAKFMRLSFEVATQLGDAADCLRTEAVDDLIGRDMLDEIDGQGREPARARQPAGAALVDEIEMEPQPFALGLQVRRGSTSFSRSLIADAVHAEAIGTDETRYVVKARQYATRHRAWPLKGMRM